MNPRLVVTAFPITDDGEILLLRRGIEPGLGRDVRTYRALGWCSRSGQVIPVQGVSPDVLIRGVSVRASA